MVYTQDLARMIALLALSCLALLQSVDSFVIDSRMGATATTRRMNSGSSWKMARDDDMSPEERAEAVEKATKAMTAFTNKYLENTGTKLCSDLAIPAVVIKGLAEHKVSLGAPLCPCRFYDDKEAEAKDGFWNCPCVPMRERHECHCMLFLKEDNDFAGDEKVITTDDVFKLSTGMG
jgi:ferredoxin-thioredoxin reductase catalytic chain